MHTKKIEKKFNMILKKVQFDLEYPQELHVLPNEYPLAAKKVNIKKDMLSKYCKEISYRNNMTTGQVKLLVPTLNNKENYVLRYRNLLLYFDLGLKLKKIH